MHSYCAGLYREGGAGFCYIRGRSNAYLFGASEPPDPECFCHAPLTVPYTPEEQTQFNAAAVLFLEWVEDYERWLEALVGVSYRDALHPHAPMPWLPPSAARRWFVEYRRDPVNVHVPRRRMRSAALLPSSRFFRNSNPMGQVA